jgi:hypothetical protein
MFHVEHQGFSISGLFRAEEATAVFMFHVEHKGSHISGLFPGQDKIVKWVSCSTWNSLGSGLFRTQEATVVFMFHVEYHAYRVQICLLVGTK